MKRFKQIVKRTLQILSLILIDILAYYASMFLAIFARNKIAPLILPHIPTFQFTFVQTAQMLWIPAIFIFFNLIQNLYQTRFPFWEETRNLIKSLTVSFFFVFVAIYISALYGSVLRLFLVSLWVLSLFIFPFFRYWGKKLLYNIGIWRENALIIGSGKNAEMTIHGIMKEKHLGYHIVGMIDDDYDKIGTMKEIDGKEYKIYGDIEHFDKFVQVLGIETIFIADPKTDIMIRDLINRVYRYVRRMIIIPDITGVSIFNSELHFLFMEKLFMIKVHNNLNSKTNLTAKRFFDFFTCLIGFIIISPIFLLIALLIKLTSRGPVLFSHKRVGRDGKEFGALKFRTMYQDAEERLHEILENDPEAREQWETSFKLKNDPRITPIGKFLRKTSLDELPQIFNILKGEMSLVGPRPVIQKEIDKYYGDYSDYYYSVTPGLTGLWQVSGRSDTDYDFRVQTDVWYIQNWSLWLDIIILLRTIMVVLKAKGAY